MGANLSSIPMEYPSLSEFFSEELRDLTNKRMLVTNFRQWGFVLASLGEICIEAENSGFSVGISDFSRSTPFGEIDENLGSLTNKFNRTSHSQRWFWALRTQRLDGAEMVVPEPSRKFKDHHRSSILNSAITRGEIRKLTYRGSPMGRAILQLSPSPNLSTHDEQLWPKRWTNHAIRSYIYVFEAFQRMAREFQPAVVVVYNGRFLHEAAVRHSAETMGIKVLYFDTGGTDTDFDLTSEGLHDWSALQRRMMRLWDGTDSDSKTLLAAEWFDRRVNHQDADNALFVEKQIRGLGIDIAEPKVSRDICFFSSSLDEVAELDCDWTQYFNSQEEALKFLKDVTSELQDSRLIVRTHPHMLRKSPADLDRWYLSVADVSPSLHIDASSSIDTYELARSVDLVVTYGSTVGVEAAYLGKPVVVMGPSAYDELGSISRVRTPAELRDAISSARSSVASDSLKYGLFMRFRGFRIQQLAKSSDGEFQIGTLGVELGNSRSTRFEHLLRNLRLRWLRGVRRFG